MKRKAMSKPFSKDPALAETLINLAPDECVHDDDNPPTKPGYWDDAIVSYSYEDLKTKLTKRRARGPQKRPTKEQIAIRLDRSVLDAFRESGSGWQSRVNAALLDWLKTHNPKDIG